MFTSTYGYDRTMAVIQVPYGRVASPEPFLAKMARLARTSWDERQNVKMLSALEDHQLHDIGIARSEIGHLARTSAEDPRGEHRSIK